MSNNKNNPKKMKLVGWIADAGKDFMNWGKKEAKKEAAHDSAEFTEIISELETIPTTTPDEIEEWLDNFDKKLKNMKHSPEVSIPTKMLFQKFYRPVIDQLELKGHSPDSPELVKVVGLTAASLGLGLAAYAAGMVVETLSLGQIDGFDKFWDQIVQATGIYRISRLMTSLPLELGVLRPMGYEYNSVYQTYKPKMNEITRWYGRGHIGDDGMKEFMRWHGIEPQYFDEYKRSASRETSYFMLNAIAREGMYDEEKFKFWLSDAGYGAYSITTPMLTEYEKEYGLTAPEETQIDFLLRNYRKMSEKAEFSGIQGVAKNAYIRGEITAEQFHLYLEKIGKPQVVRDMIIHAADLKKIEEKRELTYSIDSKLYRIGRITVEEFRERLKGRDYPDESITELIFIEDLKKMGEPETLTRGQIEGMFRRTTIDEPEFRARLTNMNYSDVDIELMVKDNLGRMVE